MTPVIFRETVPLRLPSHFSLMLDSAIEVTSGANSDRLCRVADLCLYKQWSEPGPINGKVQVQIRAFLKFLRLNSQELAIWFSVQNAEN